MTTEEVPSDAPNWLRELEAKRERRLKVKLGHEAGAGSPCLNCKNDCPGLDLHFWRKICKNCKCGKESHDVQDDDIYGWTQFQLLGSKPTKSKKIVLTGRDEVELEWAPKGSSEAVEKYLKDLPPELLPVKGSAAAQERKQLLQKQIPIHDIDPTLCDALTEDEVKQMNDYITHVKESSVGVGQVVQLNVRNYVPNRNITVKETVVKPSVFGHKVLPFSVNAIVESSFPIESVRSSYSTPLRRTVDEINRLPVGYKEQRYVIRPNGSRLPIASYEYVTGPNGEKLVAAPNSGEKFFVDPDDARFALDPNGNSFLTGPNGDRYFADPTDDYRVVVAENGERCAVPTEKFVTGVNGEKYTIGPYGERFYVDPINERCVIAPNGVRYAAATCNGERFPVASDDVRFVVGLDGEKFVLGPNGDKYFVDSGDVVGPNGERYAVTSDKFEVGPDGNRFVVGAGGEKLTADPNDDRFVLSANGERFRVGPDGEVFAIDKNDCRYLVGADGDRFLLDRNDRKYRSDPNDGNYVIGPNGDRHLVPPDKFESGPNGERFLRGINGEKYHADPNNANNAVGPYGDRYLVGADSDLYPLDERDPRYARTASGDRFLMAPNGDRYFVDPEHPSTVIGEADGLKYYIPEDPNGNKFDPIEERDEYDPIEAIKNKRKDSNLNWGLANYNPKHLRTPDEDLKNPTQVKIGIVNDIAYEQPAAAVSKGTDEVSKSTPSTQSQQCHRCKKVFEDNAIIIQIDHAEALFHSNCFRCSGCNQNLADLVYFYDKESDQIYCGRDYAKIRGIPRCNACDELIFVKEYCLAENCTFHIKHFCCFECDATLAGQNYVMEESQPICLPCFDKVKANKCNACLRIIKPDEQGAELKGVHFHARDECFACNRCKKPLLGAKLLFRNQRLYCSVPCFNEDC